MQSIAPPAATTRPRMLTMFTDASFCHHTQAAGWGAWAKADGWAQGITFGAAFRRPMGTIHDAELCAVVNAVHRLISEDRLVNIGAVMVQSDSMRALTVLHAHGNAKIRDYAGGHPILTQSALTLSSIEIIAIDRLQDLLSGSGIEFLVRHVKGHSTGSTRHSVNATCDRIAKTHMWSARKSHTRKIKQAKKQGG